MTNPTARALIAQEIKKLNFLLQNPKLTAEDYSTTLETLKSLTEKLTRLV